MVFDGVVGVSLWSREMAVVVGVGVVATAGGCDDNYRSNLDHRWCGVGH